MELPKSEEFILTRADVLKALRKYSHKRRVFVRGATFLETTRNVEDGTRRGFDMSTLVPTSVKIGRKYIEDLLSDSFDKRGAKIKITVLDNIVCIG